MHKTGSSVSRSLRRQQAHSLPLAGRYKTLNLVFGILPFIAALLIVRLSPKSGVITQWLSIVGLLLLSPRSSFAHLASSPQIPLGFGNAVVLQTTFIALLVSIDRKS